MCSIIGEQGDKYKELHALRPYRAMRRVFQLLGFQGRRIRFSTGNC